MTLNEREEIVRKKGLCFKCLLHGHRSVQCESDVKCEDCGGKHYGLLCRGIRQRDGNMAVPQQQQQPRPPPQSFHPLPPPQQQINHDADPHQPLPRDHTKVRSGFCNVTGRKSVALMTMLVVVDTDVGPRSLRVFIDGGSEESYIQEDLAKIVKHQYVDTTSMKHQVFGGVVTAPKSHDRVLIKLKNAEGSVERTFRFNTIKKIAERIPQPAARIMEAFRSRGIVLHDQSQFKEEVHMLIGADVAEQIWTGGFLRLDQFLTAKETIYGWVISGTQGIDINADPQITHMVTSFMLSQMKEEDLWSLEALGIQDDGKGQTRRDLEEAALSHFESTVKREPDGRYQVTLPWLQGHRKLCSNRDMAVTRLKATTQKLKRDGYYEKYDAVFQQWLDEGVIEKAQAGKSSSSNDYFLPHRPVLKLGSTTPVRPVFDAGAKKKNEVSLNDCLEKGPNMLERIPAVLSRFRMGKVGVIADVKKAFLQMSVAERDRNALQFLWWSDDKCQQMVTYRHARVVFGVKSSPFLLAITLRHHLLSREHHDPDVAVKLVNSLYVDNSVSSCPSWEEAIEFQRRSQKLLIDAKFDLRGWEFGPSEEDRVVPVLGLNWNLKTDTLSLNLDGVLEKLQAPATKRGLLSAVASVFDLMGYVSPFTIIPKLLFQRVCLAGINWDDELPADIGKEFELWKSQVPALRDIEIPRWVGNTTAAVSMHTFSDASSLAYACCSYLRWEFADGSANVKLIMSKSRVAPANKKLSIPRLELMGCLIGVRMAKEIKGYLDHPDIPSTYWTDSSAAVAWISHNKPWARFVQGRVDEILQHTRPDQWRHVPGEYNPADLPSRGCSAERLSQLQWGEGPEWLRSSEESWPKSSVNMSTDEAEVELKKTVVSALSTPVKDPLDRLKRCSSFHLMLGIVGVIEVYKRKLQERARCRREGVAMEKLQLLTNPSNGNKINVVVDNAENILLLYVQRSGFEGIHDPRLRSLDTFLDDEGILRIKSSLYYGDDKDSFRCPAVLPGKHEVVEALIRSYHWRNCHAGVQTLMAIIRERFWILKSRRTISSVVNSCVVCQRFRVKRCEVPRPPLPRDRLEATYAFEVTGVDLLGPLFLCGGEKIWVVLFTCAVYRCIHLEIVPTLSTAGFIKAFRRFVARRNRPKKIYSDNGLNFIGCSNLFKQLNWKEVERYTAVDKIQWIFNPPTAAWWGGWWERLVGLTKQLLRRVLGKRTVDMEEFITLTCDVERTVNHRPLSYISDMEQNLVPLCPAHFMTGIVTGGLPEADAVDGAALQGGVRRVQAAREELRLRFRREYLGQLKHLTTLKEKTVKVGDVVLVEIDDKKRIDWPLGRIQAVYPGRDGRIRTALVRVRNNAILRPVQRLFRLETSNKEQQELSLSNSEDLSSKHVVEEEQKTVEVVSTSDPQTSRSGRRIKKPERLEY